MTALTDRVKRVIGTVLNTPGGRVTDDASTLTTPGWDSLGHAQLMFALEDEFGIEIPTELVPELHSLDDIVTFLSGRMPDSRG